MSFTEEERTSWWAVVVAVVVVAAAVLVQVERLDQEQKNKRNVCAIDLATARKSLRRKHPDAPARKVRTKILAAGLELRFALGLGRVVRFWVFMKVLEFCIESLRPEWSVVKGAFCKFFFVNVGGAP